MNSQTKLGVLVVALALSSVAMGAPCSASVTHKFHSGAFSYSICPKGIMQVTDITPGYNTNDQILIKAFTGMSKKSIPITVTSSSPAVVISNIQCSTTNYMRCHFSLQAPAVASTCGSNGCSYTVTNNMSNSNIVIFGENP